MVRPTVIINELLSISNGMEVAGVLCETFECCLGVDHTVQALWHGDLHGFIDS